MNEQQRFNRIGASIQDIAEARDFARALKARLDQRPDPPAHDVVARALTTALVVAYARPFSGNRHSDEMVGRLCLDVEKSLDKNELALHRHIISIRNKAFAHADGACLEPTIEDDHRSAAPIPWIRDVRVSLGPSELDAAEALCDRLLHAMETHFRQVGRGVREQLRGRDG